MGSSSVKVSLLDEKNGQVVASASYPEQEAPIKALQPGWAEQRPDDWWEYFKQALAKLSTSHFPLSAVQSIGISYQMHGLVCLDGDLHPLRDAIIWCDSRGVPYGQQAYDALGHETCMGHILNAPGNFTATKLAWVRENEPELFAKIRYIMLPGDWLALRLSGTPATTACGLSEMMLWYFAAEKPWYSLMDHFGFPHEIIPPLVPTFGEQGRVSATVAAELGIPAGIPIAYRAGDQPNNALSLGVLNPGEVATTAGTSGVVYGIQDNISSLSTPSHNLNTFLHVNGTLGLMHCINGCGILNAWMRRMVAPGMGYDEMNRMASTVPVGSEGLSIIPFGNGAERVLQNRNIGSSLQGIDFNRHGLAHLLRATQEGIAFALYYGMEMMGAMQTIKAGRANMFLSPLFREALSTVSGATIELYDTDGAAGAARGAGMGCGIFASPKEAFSSLQLLGTTAPSSTLAPAYRDAYARWKEKLQRMMS